MNDDEHDLRALGRRARREEGLDDPAWDALSRDEIAEEERAALAERSPVCGAVERPYEVFRPFDADERAQITDAVLARLDAASSAPPAKEKSDAATDVPAAPVIPLRPAPRRSVRIFVGLALAAALGLGAWLVWRVPPKAPALTAYHLETTGGDATHLGDAQSGEIRLGPGSRLSFALTPDASIDGALAVEAFLVGDSITQRRARPWNAPLLRKSGGALRVEGTREALFDGIADGLWEVVFIVGRPESMPSQEALVAIAERRAPDETSGGLQVLRARVRLVPGKTGRAIAVPPRIELGGCAAVRTGPVCEVRSGQPLVVWTETAAPGDVEITAGGRPTSATPTPIQGGLRWTVRLSEPAPELRITLRRGDPVPPVTVALDGIAPSPELDDAIAAARRGDTAAAERRIADVERSSQPEVRLQGMRQRARFALRRGAPEAEALFRRAIDETRALGRASEEAEDRAALAYHLLFGARRIDDARAVLEAPGGVGVASAGAEVVRSYYLGLADMEVGNLRAALASLGASERGAERLGLDDMRGAALDVIAEALATLGRYAESARAAEDARRLVPADAQPCERARGASNFGWALFRARGSAERRDAALLEAAAIARKGCPAELGHILTNVAVAAHASGRMDEARRALTDAQRASNPPDPRDVVWWHIVEGRIALAEGRAVDARATFEALTALGETHALPEAMFEGSLGRADALALLRDEPGARATYKKADEVLATWAGTVPLGEGREAFLTAHGRAARSHLGAIVAWAEKAARAADPRAIELRREGAQVARSTATRAVVALADVAAVERLPASTQAAWSQAVGRYRAQRAVLEEKAAWGPRGGQGRMEAVAEARDALRKELDQALALLGGGPRGAPVALSPKAGEVHVAFADLGAAWVAFTTTAEATDLHQLGPVLLDDSPGALAARIPDPLRDELRRSSRVRIVSDGPGSGLDFHRLPLDGAPLFASRTVVYGLDAGAPSASPNDAEAARIALVVVDPTQDAPGVRAIAAETSSMLVRRGWRVERLDGEAATHAAVRAALERPDVAFFHYAGHALFEGLDGAQAGLRLGGDARFTVADVLALGRVPREIVLLACEGGRTESGGAAGLGIAQAFLLRGADAAVAAPRAVEDVMASRLGGALAAELGGGKSVPDALCAAQAVLFSEAPSEVDRPDGWSAFRAWVR